MVEKLDGLGVEGEVPKVLVVEEMYGVFVELEGESLEERDVICQHLFVGEVKLENNDGVDMVVREKVV